MQDKKNKIRSEKEVDIMARENQVNILGEKGIHNDAQRKQLSDIKKHQLKQHVIENLELKMNHAKQEDELERNQEIIDDVYQAKKHLLR